jgi:aspartate aminotransferase-like enzyme
MINKSRLFTPGPTPLLPASQFAMAAADIHHRTPEFRAMFLKVLKQLQAFIGTSNDVVVLTCSGTGAMEAAVSNLTNPGDTVLVISAGKFGERWVSLAKTYGCKVRLASAAYGQPVPMEEVRAQFSPEVRAVFVQATETSTGVRHCIPALAEMVRGSDAMLVVDAITGLGTTELDVSGVDVIVGGSQKALMIPPGLCFLGVSERAWKRMESSTQPRYYFHLPKERKSQAKGESAYTPSVALIAALGAALDYLGSLAGGDVAEGRRLLVDNAERCAAMTRAGMQALGLKLFAPLAPSAAATAVLAPEGISSSDIVKKFKADFGGILSDGQGEEMKGKIFRVAHVGYLDYIDTIGIVGGLEQVLERMRPGKFPLGAALTAAQRVDLDWRSGKREARCACGRLTSECIAQAKAVPVGGAAGGAQK